MGKYLKLTPPKRGSKITVAKNGLLQVPDDPIVPFIQGDGIPTEMWEPVQEVLDVAVDRCYGNAKRLEWMELYAGPRAAELYGDGLPMPKDTLRAVQEYKVCIKGPLTPSAEQWPDRAIREHLDLFAHVQPIRYLEGAPAPLKNPHPVNLSIFREHTEDLRFGVEWKKGSAEAKELIALCNGFAGAEERPKLRPDAAIAIKAISATATKRLLRLALDFSVKHRRRSITFVHAGDRLPHTEGFFRDWGYELAKKEFGDYTVTEEAVEEDFDGQPPRGRVIVRDRSISRALSELVTQPEDYDVIATTNQNGLLLERVCLASVRAGGLAPVAHVGAKAAIFEARHAELPPADPDEQNPSSALLCGVMLFEHLGWKDAAELVTNALIKTISDGCVTSDLAPDMDEEHVPTAEFCEAVIENFEEVRKSKVRQAIKRAASGIGSL